MSSGAAGAGAGPARGSELVVLPVSRNFWMLHAHVPEELARRKRRPKSGSAAQEALNSLYTAAMGRINQEYEKFKKAPRASMQGRLYRGLQALLDTLDPTEGALRRLAEHPRGHAISLVYPGTVPERAVRRGLRLVAQRAGERHWRRLTVWGAMLPLTGALGILPIPGTALLFGWNLFRTYCHHRAYHGSRLLLDASAAATRDPPPPPPPPPQEQQQEGDGAGAAWPGTASGDGDGEGEDVDGVGFIYRPSAALARVAPVEARWRSALSEEQIRDVARIVRTPDFEHAAAQARRRILKQVARLERRE